ncbi:MAG TPA: CHAT domain-containing tetratricopeptide repeat protein [Vicinamibacteria bacterium]|nr:CHAT domain-containing tetratricopeptide repeat protein [Vicinamibacteria bacterium]
MKLILAASLVFLLFGGPTATADPQPASDTEEAPAPSATQEVQALLDEVERLIEGQDLAAALNTSEAAVELARSREDAAGEALGWRARARIFETQDRFEDALVAWREVREAWRRAADGPGEIEAIVAEARVLLRDPAWDATALLDEAVALMGAETRRPVVAAETLGRVGDSLRVAGRMKEANRLCASAVERLEVLAPDSLPLATSLNNLGNVAASQGDLTGAQERYLRALTIQEEKVPGSLDVATSLNNLGIVADLRENFTGAREYYLRALAIRETKAPASLDVATSLYNLCAMAWTQGDLTGAREYCLRALTIREAKVPGSLDVAETLNALGAVAYSHGDLPGARAYYLPALEIREAKVPGSLEVAESLNNLGNVALSQGDLGGAREYHLRALATREARLPGSLDVAASLNNLGIVAYLLGDLAGAREFYLRAVTIQEARDGASLHLAASLSNLGGVASLQGDLAGAREFFLRGLVIRETKAPGSPDVGKSLLSLGRVAASLGDLTAAREYFLHGLAIFEAKAPGSLDLAMCLGNLGLVVHAQGDLAGARGYFERALAIRAEKAPDSLDVAVSLQTFGLVALSQGDLAGARGYYERALAIFEAKAPDSLRVATGLKDLANVARQEREFARALSLLAQSWRIVRLQGALVTGDQAKQAFGETFAGYSTDLLRVQLDLGERLAAFATLEESRSQALLQMLALRGIENQLDDPSLWNSYREAEFRSQQGTKRLADASTSLDKATAELDAARSEGASESELVRKQDLVTAATTEREAALAEYTRLRLEMEERLADVRKAIPTLREDAVSLEDARRVLPPDSVWVAFSVGEEDTVVFLVPSSPGAEITAYVLPIKQAELAARVIAIVERIRSRPPPARPAWRRSEAELVAAGRDLYGLLFPESARSRIEQAARLMVSPDDVLWGLPFAALVMNQEGEPVWLGVKKPLSFQQSLSAYVREREIHQGVGDGALIVGNPDFGSSGAEEVRGTEQSGAQRKARKTAATDATSTRTVDWSRGERSYFLLDGKPPAALPGAEREATELAVLYATDALLGSEATEPSVRQRISSAGVVHLATHGYFHPTMPMASGVLLSLPDVEPETGKTDRDGVLQAYELSGELKLAADLFVLSACETGRGRMVRGEGLVGLTRALQMAGARSVVATHWRIDDAATGRIMVAFHRNVLGGSAKDEALRKAMEETHSQGSKRHPYYWAAYFLSGAPDVAVR